LQGVRTLVLTNATGAALEREQAEGRRHRERWVHFPDVPGFDVTNKSGDLRAAVGPALATAQLGTFRWLLYSDVSAPPQLRTVQQLHSCALPSQLRGHLASSNVSKC
jgi:hypothetical protein